VGDHGKTWRIVDGLITVCGRPFVAVTSLLLQAILERVHGASMKASRRPCTGSALTSTFQASVTWCTTSCAPMKYASGTKGSSLGLSACSNHWRCPQRSRRMSPWTSLRASHT
jgi:hypothetical protein